MELSATRLSLAALGIAVLVSACGGKLEPQQCNQVRVKAFAVINEAATCKTDADCQVSSWPGCPHEANQDQLSRLKPIKDEYEKGKCEEPKQDCGAAPEVFCNQFVCEKRAKAIRTDQP